MGLSLFLPAGSRGKTRWVEETQSYSLKRPKFCLDIGEHLTGVIPRDLLHQCLVGQIIPHRCSPARVPII